MENWLIGIMNEFGYVGVFFLIALENIFPPIPSEVILTFAGFMTTSTDLNIFGVVLSATAGSLVGACALYRIGLLMDVERLEKVVDRWGTILRLTKKDIHKADNWFDKHGYVTVFLCRLIPLIRSLISIPAGMSNMKFGTFLIYTAAGTLIWNIVLVSLGASVGENWKDILNYFEIYSKLIYLLIIVTIVVITSFYIKKVVKKIS
ncbi:MAG: alkaline phosphatase [Bacillales bacterium]|jgi:membrane protein DedA with SNARE-associated domain|nr:alkaline phosphatase [Bacillales bacterium]